MKINAYIDKNKLELEVYKVQVSLFGQPAILIYNEDRSYMYEETNQKVIESIKNLIGKNTIKTYVAGNVDPEGKIHLMKVLPKDISNTITW